MVQLPDRLPLSGREGTVIPVEVELLYDGFFYVRGRSYTCGRRFNPGDKVGDLIVLRYLGHRFAEGRSSGTSQTYFLVRCPHEIEGPRSNSELHSIADGRTWSSHRNGKRYALTGCFRVCTRRDPFCVWCGTRDVTRFPRGGRGICMACDRVAHRRGRFPCGKPRRAFVSVDVAEEHNCDACLPWRRAGAA